MTSAPHQTRFEDAGSTPDEQPIRRPAEDDDRGAVGLRVIHELDATRWATFLRRVPDVSIFHTPEMHRVFEDARGHRPAVWAAADEADEIRALLTTVTIATVGGPLRSMTARTVAFAGPLMDGDPEALRALLRGYRRRAPAALFTEIRNVSDPGRTLAMRDAYGFRHEGHLNYLIDLTMPEEELWGRVASSAQRNIRKARRVGVTIEMPEDAIDEAYPILRDVYRRIEVPLPDRSLFDAATRILGPLGRFKVLLARHEGRTVGALTLLIHGDVATYWYTGTLSDARSQRPGDLLVAAALDTARAAGCRVFDFGGAGRPDEPYGVRDFKAKYAGRLVDFGRDVWVPSPLRFRIATRGYEILRRFL